MTSSKQWITWFVLTVFCFQSGMPSAGAQNLLQPFSLARSETPSSDFPVINISSDHGTVESVFAGSGPVIFHIQEAHGSSEVQKNIQGILRELKSHYGVNLVLVEGSAFPLEPELLSFSSGDSGLSRELAEALARKSLLSGPELFLLEESSAQAYGIEDAGAYLDNGRAFRDVLLQKEKTADFSAQMNIQIQRLTSPYLSQDLRAFLNRLEDFERGLIPLDEWLREIQKEALKNLGLDLENPYFQLEWPMLLRLFMLKKLKQVFDESAFSKEREAFLSEARKYLPNDLFTQVEEHLVPQLLPHHLADPATSLLFENMAQNLPRDFDYGAYPNVNRFIGQLILHSELKPALMGEELEKISDQIAEKMAHDSRALEVVELLKGHRLLKHLFSLELTPRQYLQVKELKENLRPWVMAEKFRALNEEKRVKDSDFEQLAEMDKLYDLASAFYEGTHARDRFMFENIEKRLKETGETKAAVITGGFHSGPFQDYFQSRDYAYALISPKISQVTGRDQYVRSILTYYTHPKPDAASTYKEAPYFLTRPADLRQLGVDPEPLGEAFRETFAAVAGTENIEPETVEWFRQFQDSPLPESELADSYRSELRSLETILSHIRMFSEHRGSNPNSNNERRFFRAVGNYLQERYELEPGFRVLEPGLGYARNAADGLFQAGASRVTGINNDEGQPLPPHPQIEVIQGDAEQLPWSEPRFEAVVFNATLSYIAMSAYPPHTQSVKDGYAQMKAAYQASPEAGHEKVGRVLDEALRVLADEGVIVFRLGDYRTFPSYAGYEIQSEEAQMLTRLLQERGVNSGDIEFVFRSEEVIDYEGNSVKVETPAVLFVRKASFRSELRAESGETPEKSRRTVKNEEIKARRQMLLAILDSLPEGETLTVRQLWRAARGRPGYERLNLGAVRTDVSESSARRFDYALYNHPQLSIQRYDPEEKSETAQERRRMLKKLLDAVPENESLTIRQLWELARQQPGYEDLTLTLVGGDFSPESERNSEVKLRYHPRIEMNRIVSYSAEKESRRQNLWNILASQKKRISIRKLWELAGKSRELQGKRPYTLQVIKRDIEEDRGTLNRPALKTSNRLQLPRSELREDDALPAWLEEEISGEEERLRNVLASPDWVEMAASARSDFVVSQFLDFLFYLSAPEGSENPVFFQEAFDHLDLDEKSTRDFFLKEIYPNGGNLNLKEAFTRLWQLSRKYRRVVDELNKRIETHPEFSAQVPIRVVTFNVDSEQTDVPMQVFQIDYEGRILELNLAALWNDDEDRYGIEMAAKSLGDFIVGLSDDEIRSISIDDSAAKITLRDDVSPDLDLLASLWIAGRFLTPEETGKLIDQMVLADTFKRSDKDLPFHWAPVFLALAREENITLLYGDVLKRELLNIYPDESERSKLLEDYQTIYRHVEWTLSSYGEGYEGSRAELRESSAKNQEDRFLEITLKQFEALRYLRETGNLRAYYRVLDRMASNGLVSSESFALVKREVQQELFLKRQSDAYPELLFDAYRNQILSPEEMKREFFLALQLHSEKQEQWKSAHYFIEQEIRTPFLEIEERQQVFQSMDLFSHLWSNLKNLRDAYEKKLIEREYLEEKLRELLRYMKQDGFVNYFAPLGEFALELGLIEKEEAHETLLEAIQDAEVIQNWIQYVQGLELAVKWKVLEKKDVEKRFLDYAQKMAVPSHLYENAAERRDALRAMIQSGFLDDQGILNIFKEIRPTSLRAYYVEEYKQAYTTAAVYGDIFRLLLQRKMLTDIDLVREGLDALEEAGDQKVFHEVFLEVIETGSLPSEEILQRLEKEKEGQNPLFYVKHLLKAFERGYVERKFLRPILKNVMNPRDLMNQGWLVEDFDGLEFHGSGYGEALFELMELGLLTERESDLALQTLRQYGEWSWFTDVLHREFELKKQKPLIEKFLQTELALAANRGVPVSYQLYLTYLARQLSTGDLQNEELAGSAGELLRKIEEANPKAEKHQQINFESFKISGSPGLAALQVVSESLARQVISNRVDRGYLPLLQEELQRFSEIQPEFLAVLKHFYQNSGKEHLSYPDLLHQLSGFALAFQRLGLRSSEFEELLSKEGSRREITERIGQRIVLVIARRLEIKLSANQIRNSHVLEDWYLDYLGLLIATQDHWDIESRDYFKAILRFALEGRFRALIDPAHYEEIDRGELDERTGEVVSAIRAHNEYLLKEAEALKIPLEALLDPQSMVEPLILEGRQVEIRPGQILRQLHRLYLDFENWENREFEISERWRRTSLPPSWQKFFSDDEAAIAAKPGMIRNLAQLQNLEKRLDDHVRRYAGQVPEEVSDLAIVLRKAVRFAAGEALTEETGAVGISFWKRLPGQDVFLGNCVDSCTSLGTNASAVFEFLLDLGTHYVVLRSANTQKVRAYARFFFYKNEEGQPGIYIDSLDGNVSEEQRKAILDYVRTYGVKIGIPKDRVKDREEGVVQEKMGGALTGNYFHHSGAEISSSWESRSELRSQKTIDGPDGPIVFELMEGSALLLDAFDTPPASDEEKSALIAKTLQRLADSNWSFIQQQESPKVGGLQNFYTMYGESIPGFSHGFGWFLENLSNLGIDSLQSAQLAYLLEETADSYFRNIMEDAAGVSIASTEEGPRVYIEHTDEDSFGRPFFEFSPREIYEYWIVRILQSLEKLARESADDEFDSTDELSMIQAMHEDVLLSMVRKLTLAILNLYDTEGIEGQSASEYLEKRFFDLAKNQPKLTPWIAKVQPILYDPLEYLDRFDFPIMFEVLTDEFWDQLPEALTPDELRVEQLLPFVLGKDIAEESEEQTLVNNALFGMTAALKKNAVQDEGWRNPLDELRSALSGKKVVLYDLPGASEAHEGEGRRVPSALKFFLAFLNEAAESGFRNLIWEWDDYDNNATHLRAWWGSDTPLLEVYIKTLENFLREPGDVSFAEYMTLPHKKEKTAEVVQTIAFWEALRSVVRQHSLDIRLVQSLKDGQPETAPLNSWMGSSLARGEGVIIVNLGILERKDFTDSQLMSGHLSNDSEVLHIESRLSLPEPPEKLGGGATAFGYSAYQVSLDEAFGTGDYRTSAIRFAGNNLLYEDLDSVMAQYYETKTAKLPPFMWFHRHMEKTDYRLMTMPPDDEGPEEVEDILPVQPDEVPQGASPAGAGRAELREDKTFQGFPASQDALLEMLLDPEQKFDTAVGSYFSAELMREPGFLTFLNFLRTLYDDYSVGELEHPRFPNTAIEELILATASAFREGALNDLEAEVREDIRYPLESFELQIQTVRDVRAEALQDFVFSGEGSFRLILRDHIQSFFDSSDRRVGNLSDNRDYDRLVGYLVDNAVVIESPGDIASEAVVYLRNILRDQYGIEALADIEEGKSSLYNVIEKYSRAELRAQAVLTETVLNQFIARHSLAELDLGGNSTTGWAVSADHSRDHSALHALERELRESFPAYRYEIVYDPRNDHHFKRLDIFPPSKNRRRSELRADTIDLESLPASHETIVRVSEMTGDIVPFSARARLGEQTYFEIVHRVTLRYKPENASPLAIAASLQDFIRREMPAFQELLQGTADSPGRVFGGVSGDVLETESFSVGKVDFMELVPLFLLLAQRSELEYSLVLQEEQAAEFRARFREFSNDNESLLGFNPANALSNFHIQTAENPAAFRSLVMPYLTQNGVPTAVLSGQATLDRFSVMRNLGRVLLKRGALHGEILLLAAASLDEITRNNLMIYDEESLRSLSAAHAERLLAEIQALLKFLQSA